MFCLALFALWVCVVRRSAGSLSIATAVRAIIGEPVYKSEVISDSLPQNENDMADDLFFSVFERDEFSNRFGSGKYLLGPSESILSLCAPGSGADLAIASQLYMRGSETGDEDAFRRLALLANRDAEEVNADSPVEQYERMPNMLTFAWRYRVFLLGLIWLANALLSEERAVPATMKNIQLSRSQLKKYTFEKGGAFEDCFRNTGMSQCKRVRASSEHMATPY